MPRKNKPGSVGQELLNVPFPEMVERLAFSIADAQTKLDGNSVKVAEFMADTMVTLPSIEEGGDDQTFSMLALGFFPGFYRFETAEIEVKMAITMARSESGSVGAEFGGGIGAFSASVNASYSSKYSFDQEGSSRLTVKLAPAPPPTLLESYMQAMIETRKAAIEQQIENSGGGGGG